MTDVPDGCGLDLDTITPPDAVAALRSFPRRYRAVLTFEDDEDADAVMRRRPDPSTWSATEYAAHVRDVFRLFEERIRTALRSDGAEVADWDHEAAAERYAGEAPAQVVEDLGVAADRLAATVTEVPDDGWDRVVVRLGNRESVLAMARKAVHEGSHHLKDVEKVVRAVRGR